MTTITTLQNGDVRVEREGFDGMASFVAVTTVREIGGAVHFVGGRGDHTTQACDGLAPRGPTLRVHDGETLEDAVRRTLGMRDVGGRSCRRPGAGINRRGQAAVSNNHPNRGWRGRMQAAADQWLAEFIAFWAQPPERRELSQRDRELLRAGYIAGYTDGRKRGDEGRGVRSTKLADGLQQGQAGP